MAKHDHTTPITQQEFFPGFADDDSVDADAPNPAVKLCECGCGQPTPVIQRSSPRKGHIKGDFHRFVYNHSARNRVQTPEEKAKRKATWDAKTAVELPLVPKLCECGCGGLAPIAKHNDKVTGAIKGLPQRYINNHQPRIPKNIVICPHPERKHYGHGLCRACYQSRWMKEHPNANSGNEWLRRNPEARKMIFKRHVMKKLYGMTMEQFQEMWDKQGGKCANLRCNIIFPKDSKNRRVDGVQIDHDHNHPGPGKLVRGILCRGCNMALGRVNDDIDRLLGLIEYLRSFSS